MSLHPPKLFPIFVSDKAVCASVEGTKPLHLLLKVCVCYHNVAISLAAGHIYLHNGSTGPRLHFKEHCFYHGVLAPIEHVGG